MSPKYIICPGIHSFVSQDISVFKFYNNENNVQACKL